MCAYVWHTLYVCFSDFFPHPASHSSHSIPFFIGVLAQRHFLLLLLLLLIFIPVNVHLKYFFSLVHTFTVAVVVAFFFCWAPFHAQRLVAFYGNNQLFVYAITTYVSGILYYLSTCINPLLYNIMSNKFREAFKVSKVYLIQGMSQRSNKIKTACIPFIFISFEYFFVFVFRIRYFCRPYFLILSLSLSYIFIIQFWFINFPNIWARHIKVNIFTSFYWSISLHDFLWIHLLVWCNLTRAVAS